MGLEAKHSCTWNCHVKDLAQGLTVDDMILYHFLQIWSLAQTSQNYMKKKIKKKLDVEFFFFHGLFSNIVNFPTLSNLLAIITYHTRKLF